VKYKLENKDIEIIFSNKIFSEGTSRNDSVYVIDSKVYKLFRTLFDSTGDRIFVFDANEHSKDYVSLQKIYKFLYANDVKRNSIVFGIGGGVTTDITAFAAGTFKRGCRLILIPTTLLGMVDAAIGGKTGINFKNIKNGIGSFYPAEKVIINTDFLATLPETAHKDGLVEIIKKSFLPQSKLADMLENNNSIEEIIEEAIKTKLNLCVQDLHDKGPRRFLNLGHTFGHVLESISNYEISHGTAVVIGIRAAARFSVKKGFINSEVCQEIENRLNRFDLAKSYPREYQHLLREHGITKLKQDKKADTMINLILFKDIQNLFVFQTNDHQEIINTLIELSDVEA